MSQENVEIVRGIYAEWQCGNMKAGVERFAAEIVFESFMPDAMERIVANGPGEVEAFMREFLRHWRDFRMLGDEYRKVSATSVFREGPPSCHGPRERRHR